MISELVIDKVFLVWIVTVLNEWNNFMIQCDNPVFSGIGFDTAYHVFFLPNEHSLLKFPKVVLVVVQCKS